MYLNQQILYFVIILTLWRKTVQNKKIFILLFDILSIRPLLQQQI